ncbi:Histidine kinase (fragment) [Sphingomonas aurantiaca]|uniref:Histidine kinase n=1 Tax=Sphingomonas aurantiaca TaxID=185949 RepID=A0A5E7XWJ9_9SPHN
MAIPTVLYALVVDDDPLILRHACDIPEVAGFNFHQAGTVEEAKAFMGDDADGVTLLFSDVASLVSVRR